MRLTVVAALGTAVLAATAGAAAGWRYAPDTTSGSLVRVATQLPTGAPLYVTPECTLTPLNTLKNADGSAPDHIGGRGGPIPPGFTPVRAVRCGEFGDGMSITRTQAEIQDPQALSALTAAYRSTTDLEYRGPVMMVCADYADLDPAVALVDAHGTAIWPGPPRDSCDHVVAAVKEIVEKGPWVVTRSVTTH